MYREILFLTTFSIIFLIILQSSFSQEETQDENIKIAIRRFAPSLSLSIPQGGWKRLDFFIQNQHNESVIMFYRIEKPSGVDIDSYPPKYYSLSPNTEIAGNMNISIDPYLENRTYTIKFWIDTFTNLANDTVKSNKVSVDLTVLSNPSVDYTTTTKTTDVSVENTVGEVPVEPLTTIAYTGVPTIIFPFTTTLPSNGGNFKKLTVREYAIILGMVVFLLILPILMLRGISTKGKKPVSSQEEIQA
jgi:hypothetical protein